MSTSTPPNDRPSTERRVEAPQLEAWCADVLQWVGVSPSDARTTAEILVTTDTWGVFTHGVKNLRGYVRRIRAGGLRTDVAPEIVSQGPAWAIIDGHSCLGLVTASMAMNTALAKAKSAGIGYAGVRNTCHFGAAGFYAAMAAREGMIGLAMSNDVPSMIAPGSRAAVTGNNPFAVAIPAGKEWPILLDVAMSTVAGGKVYAAAMLGKSIPNTWLVDENGDPTTDPVGFPQTKSLMPMAGHKGYGLALMIESLSAILTGAAITSHVGNWMFGDPTIPTNHGAAFLAVNVAAMASEEEFHRRVDETIHEIRSAPKARGTDRIYLPGEMEWQRREKALRDGIVLPSDVVANVEALGRDLNLDLAALWR